MFKLWICIFIISFFWTCQSSDSSFIRMKVDGKEAGIIPVLRIGENTYPFVIDSAGFAEINDLPLSIPTQGLLQYGRYRLFLYLEPEKNLDIYLNLFPHSLGAEFRGAGALKNEILNGKYGETDFVPDYTLDEDTFMRSLEAVKQQYDRKIDSLHLDSFFTGLVKEKFKYTIFGYLGKYPEKHAETLRTDTYKPSEVYRDYLRILIKQEKGLLEYEDYRQALLGWVEAYSNNGLSGNTDFEILLAELECIHHSVARPQLAEFLTDHYISDYVSRKGIECLEQLLPYYEAKVKNPEKRERFRQLCEKWRKKASGATAFDFNCINADSVDIRLRDFKGKFVYLCFWNTSCASSVKSLLSLKEMERKWKNKPICFIGISTDQEEKVWKKFMVLHEVNGIQLFGKDVAQQIDFYQARQLPYFVLIDPEGKIVKADMTSPADPATTRLLQQVL